MTQERQLKLLELLESLLHSIQEMVRFEAYCEKTRLFSSLLMLLQQDMVSLFRVLYILMNHFLERLGSLQIDL